MVTYGAAANQRRGEEKRGEEERRRGGEEERRREERGEIGDLMKQKRIKKLYICSRQSCEDEMLPPTQPGRQAVALETKTPSNCSFCNSTEYLNFSTVSEGGDRSITAVHSSAAGGTSITQSLYFTVA
ncbi:hypothetical protein PAMP_024367 [Pampus punctatissimus]